MSQSTMSRCCQCLGEDVGRVLVALDVEQLEVLLGDPVSIRVELHVSVFGSRVADVRSLARCSQLRCYPVKP